MRYGHFDDERREYVISQPDTPLPWINYLGAEEYFGIISNTAGGYSFLRDARLRRLTRYRSNNVPFDFGGRYVYVRDDTTGEYWSPSWQPTQTALDSYECRHGLSYTIISSTYSGIRAETLYYVPLGETLEIWRVRLANLYDDPRDLSLFSSVEFCLWDAQDDASNFQRNFSTGEVEVVDGSSSTRRSTGNDERILRTSLALSRLRDSTPTARRFSDPTAGLTGRSRSSAATPATRSRTGGRPMDRIT